MSPRAASGAARVETFACWPSLPAVLVPQCPAQFHPEVRTSRLHAGQGPAAGHSSSHPAKDAARARAQTHDPLQ